MRVQAWKTTWGVLGAVFLAGGLAVACASQRARPATSVDVDAAAIARGGRLYDKWYAEAGSPGQTSLHPLYPADGHYGAEPATTWRCKECHGWDYLGANGAYAEGKHHTGIDGIRDAAGVPTDRIAAVLRDPDHGYASVLSESDLEALALFVSRGQVDMDAVIDRATKTVRGDVTRGSAHYATICASCHGDDGMEADMPVLGNVANSNPWETLHKILNGQPNTTMPALRSLDRQVSLDVLAYLQTLPAE